MTNTRRKTLVEIIQKRRTIKRFAPVDAPVDFTPGECDIWDAAVRECVADAGWAPFHFDRKVEGVAEPWRATILWHSACRKLAVALPTLVSEFKSGNKLPPLLSACGAMVLVHWLPNHRDEIADETKRTETNNEHLAAASAFSQNLLLLLESENFEAYWSSASLFASAGVSERLRIPPQHKLLAGIFVFYPSSRTLELEQATGGNRAKRSAMERWTREISDLA